MNALAKGMVARPTAADVGPYLDTMAAKIRACYRSEAASIVTQQFQVGRHVATVQDDAKYGEAGVKELAAKLDRPWKSLLRLATRARAFPESVVTAAVATASANDYVLHVSIFDEIASVDDPQQRQTYLEDAISLRWTVRQLRVAIRGPEETPRRASTSAPLPRLIGRAEAMKRDLARLRLQPSALQNSEHRERALAALLELTSALDDATRCLATSAPPAATSLEDVQ